MKMKITITLILILLPAAFFNKLVLAPRQITLMPQSRGYSIKTKKDPAFDQKIERMLITVAVEEELTKYFIHSFERSLVSALLENGIEASYTRADQEADTSSFDTTMRIDIKPLYRVQEDGYQALSGTEFEATAIHSATGKQVWHATGKVDYFRMRPGYPARGGVLKEFAWHTTAAIAQTFISEVTDRKPWPVYTTDDAREYHGQRID